MELMKGRPADTAGRLEREIAVYDLLDRLSIAYERTDHGPANTMEACYEIDRILGTTICKNLFLCNRQRTQFYLLMMPGRKPFHTKDLSHQIGSARLSFASPEEMERFLNLHPGAVSVMGLMNDTENHVRLLIDKSVLEPEMIACHPCVSTSSLRLRTHDLLHVFLPAVHHEATVVELPEE